MGTAGGLEGGVEGGERKHELGLRVQRLFAHLLDLECYIYNNSRRESSFEQYLFYCRGTV